MTIISEYNVHYDAGERYKKKKPNENVEKNLKNAWA